MTSILGYLQMIKSESTTPEERAEYLAIVESRAHALKALVTGFYDLSCLEAGGYALAQESVALAPLLVELAAAFYADFNADGREAEIDIAEGCHRSWAIPRPCCASTPTYFKTRSSMARGICISGRFRKMGWWSPVSPTWRRACCHRMLSTCSTGSSPPTGCAPGRTQGWGWRSSIA